MGKTIRITDTVHYVLPDGPSKGECRPFIAVKIWHQDDSINGQVFTDGMNDGMAKYTGGLHWATSVPYDPDKKPRTWHWPDECDC